METIVRVIPANISEPELNFTFDWPKEPGSFRINNYVQPLLNGANIERVNVWLTPSYIPGANGYYTDMFVDEIGRLKLLPINTRASTIYHANILTHEPDMKHDLVPIFGTAVLFLRRVWY